MHRGKSLSQKEISCRMKVLSNQNALLGSQQAVFRLNNAKTWLNQVDSIFNGCFCSMFVPDKVWNVKAFNFLVKKMEQLLNEISKQISWCECHVCKSYACQNTQTHRYLNETPFTEMIVLERFVCTGVHKKRFSGKKGRRKTKIGAYRVRSITSHSLFSGDLQQSLIYKYLWPLSFMIYRSGHFPHEAVLVKVLWKLKRDMGAWYRFPHSQAARF